MKQLKSVEMLSEVTCQNCTSYNQGQCYHELPAIPVGPNNKCMKGSWLFEGNVINFRDISKELLPVNFVNDVEDLVCKNCVSYDSSRDQCHFHRRDIYKTGPNDRCNNGTWFEDDSTSGSLRSSESPAIFFYWCASCGKVSRIIEEFPIEWHCRIMEKVISLQRQSV
jgi:hypothetical protein